ncbi:MULTISPECIES: SOS response-associated peptidase family protein [Asticcacaulis]|uniref:SOS response-associated peptidase family protein n=1 Tax=Asticcacaulis TaxID=76890 RepID=UPI001AEB4A93|nr:MULTISPECIES: SOS response-associated peptidase family protein [Asticcacaulis]
MVTYSVHLSGQDHRLENDDRPCPSGGCHRASCSRAWAKKRRVIVPASCYWEWSERLGRSRVPKQRWCIEPDSDEPLAMAGLWDHAQTADGPVLSFAILTRTPGERMQRLHDREPVVLARSEMAAWLDGKALDLSTPWNDDAFRLTPVA